MAVPRPVLLALVGLALCAAAFLSTRGARDPGGAVTALPPTPAAPAPSTAAKRPAVQRPAGQQKSQAQSRVAHKPAVNAPPKQATAPSKSLATAAEVTSALGRGDAVVFFFTRSGSADDAGTAAAVHALSGVRHVVTVRAGLGDLTEFRPVLAGAGVTQVPAVVVAHADKPARLLQGYVDPGTLRQTVADSLR